MTPEEWPPGTVLVCLVDHGMPYLEVVHRVPAGARVIVAGWGKLNVNPPTVPGTGLVDLPRIAAEGKHQHLLLARAVFAGKAYPHGPCDLPSHYAEIWVP